MCKSAHFLLPAIPDYFSNCFESKHVRGLFRPCIAIHRWDRTEIKLENQRDYSEWWGSLDPVNVVLECLLLLWILIFSCMLIIQRSVCVTGCLVIVMIVHRICECDHHAVMMLRQTSSDTRCSSDWSEVHVWCDCHSIVMMPICLSQELSNTLENNVC